MNQSIHHSIQSGQLIRKFYLAMAVLATSLVFSYMATTYLTQTTQATSHVVNIAGRQRMFSQKITKTIYRLALSSDPVELSDARDELATTLNLFKQSHDGLIQGDPVLNLPGNNSQNILDRFQAIQPAFDRLVAVANDVLTLSARSDFQPSALQPVVSTLHQLEDPFLRGMDEIVTQYDLESQQWIQRIEAIQGVLLAVDLAILFFVGYFVFRPILRLILGEYATVSEDHLSLRKFANQVPGMLYQFEILPDGRYRVPFTTDAIQSIFGCTPEEVKEDFSPVAKVIHPDDMAEIAKRIELSAKDLTPFEVMYRVNLPDKGERWIMANSMPEKTAQGSIVFNGFNMDITKQKMAELQALAHETLLLTTLSTLNEGVLVKDDANIVTYLNPKAETHLGSSLACLGRNFDDLLVHQDKAVIAKIQAQLDRVQKTHQPSTSRTAVDFSRPDGSIVHLEIWAAPILNGDV